MTATMMAELIASRVAEGGANREMANATLRDLGLTWTAPHLTAAEVGAFLAARGWSWDDVLKANA